MKKLLIIPLLLVLSGCTCTNLFQVVTFQSCINEQPDNSQYSNIAKPTLEESDN